MPVALVMNRQPDGEAYELVQHWYNISAALVTATTWKHIRKRYLPISHPPGDFLPVPSQPLFYQLEIGRGRLDPSEGHPFETVVEVYGHPRVERGESAKYHH